MKKYSIILIALLITMSLASCDWDPTGHGDGKGGGDRDTIIDFDSTDREIMILDLKIGENIEIDDSIVVQLLSAASPDDSGRNYTVVLNLSKDNGISYNEVILTSSNPTYNDQEINITVLNAYPRIGASIRMTLY